MPIAAAVTKDEEMTGERVLADDRRGQCRQPVEPSAHVGRLDGEEDANRRRKIDHGCSSRTSSS